MLDDFFSILAGQWQAAGLFVLVALSCVVAAALVQSGYHWLLYCSLFRYDRRVRKGKVVFQEERPSVSVIVCAKDEAENLERNLPEVLSQDYPDFEVIVVTIAMQYLSCAVSGMPYMGVGRNLAYRKSFFLSTKGFSSHLDLQSGDDDLFVNEYAEAGNTKVEISPLSVTVSGPKSTIWQWFVQKQRHLTTSVRYKPSSKAVLGCEMFSRALFYIAFAACMCTGNLIAVGIAGSLFIIRMVSHYVMVNKLSSVLGDRKFPCGVILLDIFIPFFNLAASLAPRKGERYKWK